MPKAELRSQFDLDFLVSEGSAPTARTILERRGYRLYGISGNSWEFKRNEQPGISLKDVYKDLQSWRVELHVEPAQSHRHSQLAHLEYRDLCAFPMPVLSSIDLFVGHGLHTSKHICSEFMRAAQLVEFRRHVLYRRDDSQFWNRLHHSAGENRRISFGLGVATLLTAQVMGEFAPEALTSWTVRRLPRLSTSGANITATRLFLAASLAASFTSFYKRNSRIWGLLPSAPLEKHCCLRGCHPPSFAPLRTKA